MSNYRKRRKVGRGSGSGNVVTAILVVFLVISLVPLLFSLGNLRGERPTQPPASVTDPPVTPTDPSVDSPDPTEPAVDTTDPAEPEATEPAPTEPEVEPTDPPAPETESGYLLYQLDSNAQKLYLNIEDNDTGASLVSDPSEACLYRWDSRWDTFVSSFANRFFVYDDADDYFNTPVIDSANVNATFQFWETDETIMSGSDCPLEGNQHPYYLAVMVGGCSYYYDGLVYGGRLEGMDSSSLAVEVFVEHVTREVVSNE